jgi:orotate phosphoribosyltransferase
MEFNVMSDKEYLLAVLARQAYEYREVPFKLSAGGESHDYIDIRKALSFQVALRHFADAFIELIEKLSIIDGKVFNLVGIESGSIALAAAIALRWPRSMQFRFGYVRKAKREHGTEKLVEGNLWKHHSTIIIEDVFTTGASTTRAIDVLRAEGFDPVLALAVVCRDELKVDEAIGDRKVTFGSLFSLEAIKKKVEDDKRA